MEKNCFECIHFPVCVLRVDVDDKLLEVFSKYSILTPMSSTDREEIKNMIYKGIAKYCSRHKIKEV